MYIESIKKCIELHKIKKIFHSFPACCYVDIYTLVRVATNMTSSFFLFVLTNYKLDLLISSIFFSDKFLLYFIYTRTQKCEIKYWISTGSIEPYDSTLSRFDLLYGSIVPSRLTFRDKKVSLNGTIEPRQSSNRT
jgi:hypothetical protein